MEGHAHVQFRGKSSRFKYILSKRPPILLTWVELNGEQLVFYEIFDKSTKQGRNIIATILIKDADIEKLPTGSKNASFGIKITDTKQERCIFDCKNDIDCSSWYKALKSACSQDNHANIMANKLADYCNRLQLNPLKPLSVALISQSYKSLCRQHHPDKGGELAHFKRIKEAYDYLTIIQWENDQKETHICIDYDVVIEKRLQGGLGIQFVEDLIFSRVLIDSVEPTISVAYISDAAGGTILDGDVLIKIESDDCSKWPLSRIAARLNNFRVPPGEKVHLIFERKVPKGPRKSSPSSQRAAASAARFSPPASLRDPILVEINIGRKREEVMVHYNDDPRMVAQRFAKRHKLGARSLELITQHIAQSLRDAADADASAADADAVEESKDPEEVQTDGPMLSRAEQKVVTNRVKSSAAGSRTAHSKGMHLEIDKASNVDAIIEPLSSPTVAISHHSKSGQPSLSISQGTGSVGNSGLGSALGAYTGGSSKIDHASDGDEHYTVESGPNADPDKGSDEEAEADIDYRHIPVLGTETGIECKPHSSSYTDTASQSSPTSFALERAVPQAASPPPLTSSSASRQPPNPPSELLDLTPGFVSTSLSASPASWSSLSFIDSAGRGGGGAVPTIDRRLVDTSPDSFGSPTSIIVATPSPGMTGELGDSGSTAGGRPGPDSLLSVSASTAGRDRSGLLGDGNRAHNGVSAVVNNLWPESTSSPSASPSSYSVSVAGATGAYSSSPSHHYPSLSQSRLEALAEAAQRHEQAGRYSAALNSYSAALAISPTHLVSLTGRASAAARLGRFDDALKDATNGVVHHRGVVLPLSMRAQILRMMGRFESAVQDFTAALAVESNDVALAVTLHLGRARSFKSGELYREAIADFSEALQLDDTQVAAYTHRGFCWRKLDDFDRSVQDYTSAIQLMPDSVRAHNNRAYSLAKMGRFKEAVQDYSTVIALDPLNSHAYHNRGISYDKLGFVYLALADFNKVLELEEASYLPMQRTLVAEEDCLLDYGYRGC